MASIRLSARRHAAWSQQAAWPSCAVLAAVLALTAAAAQARHHHRANGEAEAGRFDYYVLSLSWAPTYCLTHSDDGEECSGKGYGFVVHGLWPQYDGGGYPQQCPTSFDLSAQAASAGRRVYPSERLMRHEWLEHGTCSGLNAQAYFSTVDRASAAVKVPRQLDAPRAPQRLTASQIIGIFNDANPRMPPDAMVIACNRDSLSEVRVCLTRDLAPRPCGRGVRITCPRVPLGIPASR